VLIFFHSVAQLNEPENLDSTLPVYPSLISCAEAVENISAELVDPLFTSHLAKHLSIRSIRSVGDLAQLTERDINRLPIKSPKIPSVKKVLSRYQEKLLEKTPEKRTTNVVPSSTPLGNKRKDRIRNDNVSLEDLMKSGGNNSDLGSINVSAVYECKRAVKRLSIDSSMQTSPAKRTKRNDEEACAEMMNQCDEGFLFRAFLKRFDAEKILKGYKVSSG
jgi:telomere-associated protein RIF1